MEIQEQPYANESPNDDHAPRRPGNSLIISPIVRLGKIATNAFSDVRSLVHKNLTVAHHDGVVLPDEINDAIGKLKKIIQRSRETLAVAHTVILPVNLFPDTVTVDRTRITIVKRTFFWSADVVSIGIDDILNVSTSVGPFFGSLTISSRVMNSTDHYEIDYFWRKDAIYLKHVIQGYTIARRNNIATDELTRDQLIETLIELGREA
jgi:hypothetical protein